MTAKKQYPAISVDGFSLGTRKRAIDAVKEPSAQCTTLCARDRELQAMVNSVYSLIERNSEISNIDKAVMEIQLLSGCRIGSVLLISSKDVSPIGQVRIPPEKGGKAVIVAPFLTRQFWQFFRTSNLSIGQERNRFYFYRLYKKYGIYSLVEGNQNNSVTHLLRHVAIASTENLSLTKRERANYAGQSNEQSQQSYLPKERVKRRATKRD